MSLNGLPQRLETTRLETASQYSRRTDREGVDKPWGQGESLNPISRSAGLSRFPTVARRRHSHGRARDTRVVGPEPLDAIAASHQQAGRSVTEASDQAHIGDQLRSELASRVVNDLFQLLLERDAAELVPGLLVGQVEAFLRLAVDQDQLDAAFSGASENAISWGSIMSTTWPPGRERTSRKSG